MKKTSLEYLKVHSDIEKVINELDPILFDQKHEAFIKDLNSKRKDLLPAWLFVEAVEQAPVAISITDKKANILYVNQAFQEVTGYDMHELIGQNESILSNKSTPREVYYDLWHTISRNKIWQGQIINRHKNGHPYLADLTVAPMQDSMKNTTHYLGMHRDITDHYEAEKNLLNQKLLVESVIKASPVAMVVLDQNNKVILDNQQYKALVSDLSHKEPAELFLELIMLQLGDVEALLSSKPNGFNQVEIRIDSNSKHGPLWFSCSGKRFQKNEVDADSFFENISQNYLLLSISNITSQRKHQEQQYLQSLQVMLAEEEQIRSIRETLLGTIHQVSQPLNQIHAATQLMEQKQEKGSLLELLHQLEKSCQQTISTLNHCVPEIAPTTITSINLNQILHETLMLSNSKFLSQGILIDWTPDAILPNVLGAENKFRMLFKQLIDNAINAFHQSKKAERNIKISTHASKHKVTIKIIDNGPGIPKQQRSKVFQPFYTTQKLGGIQAGMGLVMAKEIVQQFSGSIEIAPDYDEGCCFIVSFPVINQKDYNRYDR